MGSPSLIVPTALTVRAPQDILCSYNYGGREIMEEKQLLIQIRDTLMQIERGMDDKWEQLEAWKRESDLLVESRWKLIEQWMSMLTESRSDLKDIRDRIVPLVQL
jgi:hypothetical protein